MLKKLTSRKFWACLVGVLTGVAMLFGLDETIISTISGAVVAVCSIIAYIYTEGKIDTTAIQKAILTIEEAKNTLTK